MSGVEGTPPEVTEANNAPQYMPDATRFKPGIIFNLLMEHEGELVTPGLAGEIAAAVVEQLRKAVYAEARILANDIAPQEFDLAGVGECAEILGVSKQRANQLSQTEIFPRPLVRLKAGPVWFSEAIRAFGEVRPNRPGPVPSDYYDVQK